MAEQNEATTRLIKNPKRVAAGKANAEKRRLAREAADMNLLETKSSIPITVIRDTFKSMACNCRHSIHAYDWIKAVEELDDEKLLKWYKKFEYYKKENKWMLPILGLERFNMFCARKTK